MAIKATKRAGRPAQTQEAKFNDATLNGLLEDMKSGRIPLEEMRISDNLQVGLRAYIRKSGSISFHVQYQVDGDRPFRKIGEFPEMSIATARQVAKTILTLASMGIDPFSGLVEKRVEELRKQGAKWRP